jgi:hypothetical protein
MVTVLSLRVVSDVIFYPLILLYASFGHETRLGHFDSPLLMNAGRLAKLPRSAERTKSNTG